MKVRTENGCVGVVGNGGGNHFGGWGSLVHDRVESVVVVGGVVNSSHGTVGLHERVLALDHITVTFLGLRFDVSGVGVLDAVVERVLGIGDWLGDDGLVDGRGVGVSRGGMDNGRWMAVVLGRRADGSGQAQCGNNKLE